MTIPYTTSLTDREFQQLLKASPPIEPFDASTSVAALRTRLVAIKRALTNANTAPLENETIDEEDRQIPTRDRSSIAIRIYRPKRQTTDGRPVFVMYHGGGFCLGGFDSEPLLCRKLVNQFGGVVVDVDYRLAPEHLFPTAVFDAYDALKWVTSRFHISLLPWTMV